MLPHAVLVLDSREKSGLADMLFEIGLAPVVRKGMHDALLTIRKQRFAMMVIHPDDTIDPAEVVLNVRDVEETLPVLVIGNDARAEAKDVLKQLPLTFVIDDCRRADTLARTFNAVLAAGAPAESKDESNPPPV